MPLSTINGKSLKDMQFDPLQFAIEEILPEGIFIIAGSGKIGKSWLTLDMCIAVATGGKRSKGCGITADAPTRFFRNRQLYD